MSDSVSWSTTRQDDHTKPGWADVSRFWHQLDFDGQAMLGRALERHVEAGVSLYRSTTDGALIVEADTDLQIEQAVDGWIAMGWIRT